MDKNDIKILYDTENRSKSNSKRLDVHEEEIEKLKNNQSILEKMDYRMGKVEESTEKINAKLDNLQIKTNEVDNKSNKEKAMKWDKVVEYILLAIISFALLKIGLK